VIEERPREQVASELGISTATFDVVLHRAMAALRKVIAAPGEKSGEASRPPSDRGAGGS